MIGQTLGRYHILEKLAGGGYGDLSLTEEG